MPWVAIARPLPYIGIQFAWINRSSLNLTRVKSGHFEFPYLHFDWFFSCSAREKSWKCHKFRCGEICSRFRKNSFQSNEFYVLWSSQTHPPAWELFFYLRTLNSVPLIVKHEAAIGAELFEVRRQILSVEPGRVHSRSLHYFNRRRVIRSPAFGCSLKIKSTTFCTDWYAMNCAGKCYFWANLALVWRELLGPENQEFLMFSVFLVRHPPVEGTLSKSN